MSAFKATPLEMARQFHEAFHVANGKLGNHPPASVVLLRANLLEEEYYELADAVSQANITGIADGLADMVYVLYGTALVYGIDLDAVLAEVHRSNMSKLGADGQPIYRQDGKVLKGPNYVKPNLAKVLGL